MNAAPDLSSEYSISPNQIKEYQVNGHTLCKGLASRDEVSFYRKAILEGVEKLNTERQRMEDRDTYGKAFLQIFNLWRQNDVLRKFVLAKRFAHVAAKLMGVERVRLTIINFADKTKVLKPDHDHRKKDHEVWLMSVPPGEYANSELNPVIE